MSDIIERELGWDDPIENDGPEFTILPAGDYDFEVTGLERARHGGSEKLPPCNKAIVSIEINGAEGTSIIKHNLFLHTNTEGLISAFFRAIGQRKKGERIKPNWNGVVGTKGRAKVGIKKWTYEGREYEGNEIKKFYYPDEDGGKQETSWQPGRF